MDEEEGFAKEVEVLGSVLSALSGKLNRSTNTKIRLIYGADVYFKTFPFFNHL